VTRRFTFTPALSLLIACEDEAEIAMSFTRVAERGEVLTRLGERMSRGDLTSDT
jgi:predicted 3-demethylubiquinone-9 3-methyltransferase (glyoxalase superfamily)